ncbi:unnamed protein product [Blepharisma stoltei]|uniref:Uncharacterized protein n=1 Tax=Blepharisma stoltei TaxID=1481888 RepID=A0AAU9ILN0_9CILI|nr:unnamed protein product [Blepharisma stoltei]
MRNSYLKKACWMIATINANMHAYLGQEDLLMDRELHEIIANAFKNGIYDNQLDNTSCQECKNTLEIFKKICLRNKNCMNFISNTIESNDLKYYLKKPPKEVLVVFTKAEIKNSDLISQYSLILHIDISQVKCKVNEDWYDCTGNKPRVSKYSNASFPAILVYLRKDLNPLVNDQISVQNPSYEHSPDYGRELSPSLNSLGGNLSNFDYSNQYEILDTNPKILENKQNYNQIISNSTTIENYFTYLEEKLAKKIEKDLESKSKEIIEKLLVQFQEKIGSIANNIEAKSEGEIIDMQNKLENNFNYWEEMLLNKVKELEKCFKDNEEKQNNSLSTEELLKGDRILDYMKSAVNANNSEIISKLDELEI